MGMSIMTIPLASKVKLAMSLCCKLSSNVAIQIANRIVEAEIVAVSHCAHELIPIMQMVEFLGPAVGLPVDCTLMHVCIHVNNVGALILADTLPLQYKPQSKHYHIKTIWFRELIKKLKIKLEGISSVLGDFKSFSSFLYQF